MMHDNTIAGNELFIKRFFKSLKDGSSLITKAYNGNLTDYNIDNYDSFCELKDLQIIIPSSHGYRINPLLNKMLSGALRIENGNFIDVNLKSRLPFIKRLSQNYSTCLIRGESSSAQKTFDDLEGIILEVIFEAQGAIRSLSNRLQTQFGFVQNLSDKIVENEVAIKLASDLVDNLTSFNAKELMELVHEANDDIALYRLLCIDLLTELAKCQSKLNSILRQLCDLLSKFRKQYTKTSRLKAFAELYYRYKGYQPDNFVSQDNIPTLFLKAESLKLHVHPNVTIDEQLPLLTSVIPSLKESKELSSPKELPKASLFKTLTNTYTEAITKEPLDEAIEKYLKEVLIKKELSASTFYESLPPTIKVQISKNVFLIALNTYFYEEMPEHERKLFNEPVIKGAKQYPKLNLGNTIVLDMTLKVKESKKT